MSKNKHNEYLGVNKIGKNIRKNPNFSTNDNNNGVGVNSDSARPQLQPRVYNISKNDFRSIVQQLTGSPSHHDPLPRPPVNPPKNPSLRLQRIRPPPLSPINRPRMPPMVVSQAPMAPHQVHFGNTSSSFVRPTPQFGQPSPALSPISAYMHQLQSCIGVPSQHYKQPQLHGYIPPQPRVMQHVPGQVQAQPPTQPQVSGPFQAQQPMHPQGPGSVQAQPRVMQHVPGQVQAQPPTQPQISGPFQAQQPMHPQGPGSAQLPMHPQVPGPIQAQPPMHPQGPGHFQARSPSARLLQNPNVPPLPSPGTGAYGLLPSLTSQFLLPSPGGYFNPLSPTPRSLYPLLSPGSQFPPPLSPNFAFSPFGRSGMWGSGPQPPPLSPGISFPLSPSGFFPISSPRWRDQ